MPAPREGSRSFLDQSGEDRTCFLGWQALLFKLTNELMLRGDVQVTSLGSEARFLQKCEEFGLVHRP